MMRNEPLQPVMVEEPFRLTKEEQEFVRKCLGTQFLRNDLPWSFASGFLVRMAMKAGYIKYSKVTLLSTVLGAFVFSRAVSYGQCFQSLVQQPGNTVAERMNQRKRILINQGQNQADRGILQPADLDPGYAQPNYLDVDINKPDYPGIDASTPYPEAGEVAPQSRPGQTYAELRRQNREAYVQQFRTQRPAAAPPTPEQPPSTNLSQGPLSSSPYESSSSPYGASSYSFDSSIGSYDRAGTYEKSGISDPTYPAPEKQPPPPTDAPIRRRVRTNKYGDVLED